VVVGLCFRHIAGPGQCFISVWGFGDFSAAVGGPACCLLAAFFVIWRGGYRPALVV